MNDTNETSLIETKLTRTPNPTKPWTPLLFTLRECRRLHPLHAVDESSMEIGLL